MKNLEDKLKACPFCGRVEFLRICSYDTAVIDQQNRNWFSYVTCSHVCGGHCAASRAETKEEAELKAFEKWNNRPKPVEIRSGII